MGSTGLVPLVVNDDVSVCESIGSLLRSAGYNTAAFGSAEALLKPERVGEPDYFTRVFHNCAR